MIIDKCCFLTLFKSNTGSHSSNVDKIVICMTKQFLSFHCSAKKFVGFIIEQSWFCHLFYILVITENIFWLLTMIIDK
jgi:hypothetical protein